MERSKFPPNNVFYNPSVTEDGEYICLRNTEILPNHEYNHIILYKTSTQDLIKVVVPTGMLLPTHNAYRGIEDVRIVKYQQRLWFTATSTHASADMRNVVLLGYLDKSATAIEYMTVLSNFQPPTKNICPFVYKDELYLLDAYDKKIYKVLKTADKVEYTASIWKELRPLKGDACDYRGSTSPVHLHGNTMGYVVHDVIYNDSHTNPGSKLSYTHRWIEFDIERGCITFVSTPFWCMHWGVEFVSGLRYNKQTHEVQLYLGVQDQNPCLCATQLYDLRIGKM